MSLLCLSVFKELRKGGRTMAKTVLSISNLKKLYRNGRGVEDFSIDINEGDVVGLLGPNGSGKSTVMKAVMGLVGIDSGDIKIFNYDTDTELENALEDVGCLIESPALYDNLSVYQNLKLASRYYPRLDKAQARYRIEEVLKLVNLDRYAGDKAGRLSLGMRQRLGIALALLGKPRIIILDEPTNGLDIEGVVHIRSVIKNLAEKENVTFLISGHVAAELEKVCSKAAVIYCGRLRSYEDMDKILAENPSLEDYFLEVVGAEKE